VPKRFASVEDVRPLLGAFLPGHPKHIALPVKEVVADAVLPDSFDPRVQWPKCSSIPLVRDQSKCGDCWALASVDSFQDRFCIATGIDRRFSAEDTAFCGWRGAGDGCLGGNSAWQTFIDSGVVTGGDYADRGRGKTCMPYTLKPCAHYVNSSKYEPCPRKEYRNPQCSYECDAGYGSSYLQDKVRATDAYHIKGIAQIQTELLTKGPLYVTFMVYSDFVTYSGGVYKHITGDGLGAHAVEMLGWGIENGQNYWLVKNSWNEQWGDSGFFKIAWGECGIDSDASGGTIDSAPTPPPTPVPPPPRKTHYAAPPCMAGETALKFLEGRATVCGPRCRLLSSCPQDKPVSSGGGHPECPNVLSGFLSTHCMVSCKKQSDCDAQGGQVCMCKNSVFCYCVYLVGSEGNSSALV